MSRRSMVLATALVALAVTAQAFERWMSDAAIDAALAPADSPALYFVSRNDGSHEFSTTLADHNRAVTRFQRSGR